MEPIYFVPSLSNYVNSTNSTLETQKVAFIMKYPFVEIQGILPTTEQILNCFLSIPWTNPLIVSQIHSFIDFQPLKYPEHTHLALRLLGFFFFVFVF